MIITWEDIITKKWYAVVNDVIGGYCIKLEDVPASAGGIEVADFMDQKIAEHIVELHNKAL